MFIDRAKLTVKSGKGGDGAIAFHHENIEEIDRGVRSDPSKFSARCEAVIHRNDIVKAIINEGVKIVII